MSARLLRTAALLGVVVLALSGCASHRPMLEPLVASRYPSRLELDDTPFFPQRTYQCGPAALATVLSAAGAAATPESLVEEVYLPGRRGSLQTELVAAARRHDRVPYLLPATLETLIATLAGGQPVLVLQKLGAGPLPGWHYAVVVGYDAPGERFVLRSGGERRRQLPARLFMATWERAGRWAMVTLPPGTLPPEPEFAHYMQAVAGLEAVGRGEAAAPAYLAAVRRWPLEALPRLALANLAYARGDLLAAERGFREAARLDPSSVAARNNRADVLRRLDCTVTARREVEIARALAAGGPLAAEVDATAREIAAAPGGNAAGCPVE